MSPKSAEGRLKWIWCFWSKFVEKWAPNRPSADLRLIFQQILIKNIKSSFIGLRPIWGSFFNKIKLKTSNPLLSAFGRFEAHFSTNFNQKHQIPFYRPSAHLGLIFQQNKIKNIISLFIGLRPIWGSFFNKVCWTKKIPYKCCIKC